MRGGVVEGCSTGITEWEEGEFRQTDRREGGMNISIGIIAIPPEQLLQVVRQVGTASVARVHGDEDGHVRIHFHCLANNLHGDDLWTTRPCSKKVHKLRGGENSP